jgi:hypothetical protein
MFSCSPVQYSVILLFCMLPIAFQYSVFILSHILPS